MLAEDLRALVATSVPAGDLRPAATSVPPATSVPGYGSREEQAAFRHLIDRLRAYFLTQDGKPRGERFTGTRSARLIATPRTAGGATAPPRRSWLHRGRCH